MQVKNESQSRVRMISVVVVVVVVVVCVKLTCLSRGLSSATCSTTTTIDSGVIGKSSVSIINVAGVNAIVDRTANNTIGNITCIVTGGVCVIRRCISGKCNGVVAVVYARIYCSVLICYTISFKWYDHIRVCIRVCMYVCMYVCVKRTICE